MPDPAFPAVPHFIGRPPFRDAFVTEIPRVGILGLRQFFQDALFFLGRLFDPFIELIPGGMFHVLFPRR